MSLLNNQLLTVLGIAAGGLTALAFLPRAAGQPFVSPLPKKGTGLYVPVYSNSMGDMVVQVKNAYPELPVWANMNPASGPGDEYTGHTGPRSDIQTRINNLIGFKRMVVSGYTGSWYARALDTPPQGSEWPGSHFGVIYTVSKTQYDSLIASGEDAILLQDVVDKYSGLWYKNLNALMVDEVYNGSNSAKHIFYKTIIDYARLKGLIYVRGNLGTSSPTQYFQSGWFDSVSIYEGAGLPSVSTIRGRTSNGLYAKKASFVAHHVSSVSESQVKSLAPEVQYMYITDDGGDGNPYDNPSSYILNVAKWLDEHNRSVGEY